VNHISAQREKKRGIKQPVNSIYVHISGIKSASQPKDYIGESSGLLRQPREKYFDYIVDYITPLRASTMPCHARGLTVVHSCKLSATLGGSTSTRPEVRKITLKIYDFIDISNATIPRNARGFNDNFASDRDCDSTTTTRHRRLRRADHATPDKS
jgi:hypothetical protein